MSKNNLKSSDATTEISSTARDNDIGGDASTNRATDNIAPSDLGKTKAIVGHGNRNKEKSKAGHKSNKRGVKTNDKPKHGEATTASMSRQCIGLYICKEYKGERCLGTVLSYSPKRKLLKVQYENFETEYMELKEVIKHKATSEDIIRARQALGQSNCSKKITDKERKKEASDRSAPLRKRREMVEPIEGSTPKRKTKKASSGKDKVPHVAFRIRASNA